MRLAYRVGEAAKVLGISEDLFAKRVAPELRWVRLGRVKIVAVAELQRWLDENASDVFDPCLAGLHAVEKHGDALRRLSE